MRGEGEETDSKSRDGIQATDGLDEGSQASTGRTTLSSSVRDEMALLRRRDPQGVRTSL